MSTLLGIIGFFVIGGIVIGIAGLILFGIIALLSKISDSLKDTKK